MWQVAIMMPVCCWASVWMYMWQYQVVNEHFSWMQLFAIINSNFQRSLAAILQQLETWDKKQQQDESLVYGITKSEG